MAKAYSRIGRIKLDHNDSECIDIQCEIQAVPFEDLSKMQEGEPSSAIRERVIKARKIQEERFHKYYEEHRSVNCDGIGHGLIHCNAQMTDKMLHDFCIADSRNSRGG